MNNKLLYVFIGLVLFTHKVNAQYSYELSVNINTNTGERIIAVIDAGNIGSYDGIGLVGEIFDDNGNWGQELPEKSDFRLFLKFSSGQDYGIVQERETPNIILRLRKVSDSIYHFTAQCPQNYRSNSIKFNEVINNGVSLALGNPTVLNSTGELVISEPTYSNHFDGNVSIGTTSTGSHKLAVEGSVGAREVVVEASGWADFVFEDEYELMPLTELGAFVQKNNHLPDIPTAKEVEEDGIVLGAMNAKLLQKIEELTLYILEQNERIETLELQIQTRKEGQNE